MRDIGTLNISDLFNKILNSNQPIRLESESYDTPSLPLQVLLFPQNMMLTFAAALCPPAQTH